jgi:hypothetical protein
VRSHTVMWHRAPGVILLSGLREPHVTSVSRELPTFESSNDGITITDFARAVLTR